MAMDIDSGGGKHEVNLRIRELSRHHVTAALQRVDSGEGTQFSDSTTYDLLHGDRRYPQSASWV